MKACALPIAAAWMASSAQAIESRPPPNNITPHLVNGWTWNDPFPAVKNSSLESSCEAVKHFFPLEYTLHELMEEPPNGLKPWAGGLKKLFSKREYPGGWSGYDRHGYDRSLLKMDYVDVPLELRKWIEEQERTEGDGKGLFGVFEKPEGPDSEINEVVKPEGKVDRSEDDKKIVIFAPGAIYHVLPLWVAETSDCQDQLLDLDNYAPTPAKGGVVGWPDHKRPKEDHKAEFRVRIQALKEKAEPSESAQAESGSKDEL